MVSDWVPNVQHTLFYLEDATSDLRLKTTGYNLGISYDLPDNPLRKPNNVHIRISHYEASYNQIPVRGNNF